METAVRATKLGAFDFIEKPLSIEKTVLTVRNALRQRQLELMNAEMAAELAKEYRMVGESVAMRALRKQISVVAPTDGRVLIYGESGTGKELVARAIHAQSRRAATPFVEVNSAAIPEELIESELFGHVKGAFTGATAAKKGKFELADGATLFLDEVGDMSAKVQAKVLRVLEEQRFEPVGSGTAINVDVRVIAATNKRLDLEMEQGKFRPDLFYRLNVIPFELPPLRDRPEDVPLLTEHFNQNFSVPTVKLRNSFYPTAIEELQNYSWPGNVRELRNTIERVVIMHPGVEGYCRRFACTRERRSAGGVLQISFLQRSHRRLPSRVHPAETGRGRRKRLPRSRIDGRGSQSPLPPHARSGNPESWRAHWCLAFRTAVNVLVEMELRL